MKKRTFSLFAALLAVCAVQAQEVGLCTDKGRHHTENEDSCDSFASGTDIVCVVCDGVGGAVGGRIASRTAVEAIRDYFGRNSAGEGIHGIETALTGAVEAADSAIRQRIGANPGLKGMASTCLIALIRSDTVYYSHAGDCRLYRIADGHPTQLTKDDSYMDLLIAQGEITPKQAKKHPMRRAIYNALGVEGMAPNFCGSGCALAPEEYILMCSDGLYGEVGDARIGRIVRRAEGSCERTAQKLVQAANRAGGSDNITAVVIRRNNCPDYNE